MTQADEAIERLRADVDRSDNDDLSYVCSQQYETDIRTLLAEVERLREALTGLTDAVTREVNSSDHRGGSGFLLARLADARAARVAELERERDDLRRLAGERDALRKALEKSVMFQSHYADILNMTDGGQRMLFKTADEWISRLAQIGDGP